MPEFTNTEIITEVEIDISVEFFMENCDQDEIDEVVEWLRDNGDIPESSDINLPDGGLDSDNELNTCLEKISDARYQLTNDDIENLKVIANKYR